MKNGIDMTEEELIQKIVLVVRSISPSSWSKTRNGDAYCYVAYYNGMMVELVNPPNNYCCYIIFDGLEFYHIEFLLKIEQIEKFLLDNEKRERELKMLNLLNKLK